MNLFLQAVILYACCTSADVFGLSAEENDSIEEMLQEVRDEIRHETGQRLPPMLMRSAWSMLQKADRSCGKKAREKLKNCHENIARLEANNTEIADNIKNFVKFEPAKLDELEIDVCDAIAMLDTARLKLRYCESVTPELETQLNADSKQARECILTVMELQSKLSDTATLKLCRTEAANYEEQAKSYGRSYQECRDRISRCTRTIASVQRNLEQCIQWKQSPSAESSVIGQLNKCAEDLGAASVDIRSTEKTLSGLEALTKQSRETLATCSSKRAELASERVSMTDLLAACRSQVASLQTDLEVDKKSRADCVRQVHEALYTEGHHARDVEQRAAGLRDAAAQKDRARTELGKALAEMEATKAAISSCEATRVEHQLLLRNLTEARKNGPRVDPKYLEACVKTVTAPADLLTKFESDGNVYLFGPIADDIAPYWKSWTSAQKFCRKSGMDLVSVDSPDKLQQIAQFVRTNHLKLMAHKPDSEVHINFWVGASDVHDENKLTWAGTGKAVGSNLKVLNNNEVNNFAYLTVRPNKYSELTFTMAPATMSLSYICELPAPCKSVLNVPNKYNPTK